MATKETTPTAEAPQWLHDLIRVWEPDDPQEMHDGMVNLAWQTMLLKSGRVEVYRCRTCPRTTVFRLLPGERIENARCVKHGDQPARLVGSWHVLAEAEAPR